MSLENCRNFDEGYIDGTRYRVLKITERRRHERVLTGCRTAEDTFSRPSPGAFNSVVPAAGHGRLRIRNGTSVVRVGRRISFRAPRTTNFATKDAFRRKNNVIFIVTFAARTDREP